MPAAAAHGAAAHGGARLHDGLVLRDERVDLLLGDGLPGVPGQLPTLDGQAFGVVREEEEVLVHDGAAIGRVEHAPAELAVDLKTQERRRDDGYEISTMIRSGRSDGRGAGPAE